MEIIWNLDAPVVEMDALDLIEINASRADIDRLLVGIPVVFDHTPDRTQRHSPTAHLLTGR